MSFELYYTSAARGLNPHSRGFCTVARTEGMPVQVVERLESLSNYEPVFPPGSESASRNPVSWAHWRIPVGARTRSVLSRVAFVKSDFSGRPGKFAHHLLLEPAEQAAPGPAWMLMQPGMLEETWADEPMMLPARQILSDGKPIPEISPCGPALKLADAFRLEPDRPAYVIYEPGMNLLPILNQAIGSLAATLRWQVTFNTHFAEVPAGLSCTWRCVVANSAAAAAVRKMTGMVIDLTRDMGGN